MELPETLARRDGVDGEMVIRRRRGVAGQVYELIVNGTFLMDTAETSTERLLARAILDRHDTPRRVFVAGLGFARTVAELLSDRRVEHVDVVEIEPALVDLLREGVVPGVDVVLADPRVRVHVADAREALANNEPASYDALLVDVDNGPGFLAHQANAELYEPPALRSAAASLRGAGMLGVWSAAPAPELEAALADAVGPVEHLTRTVPREGRDLDYHVYVAAVPRHQ